MPFDPDQYIAEKTASGGFDPDAYLSAKSAIPPSDMGAGEAALQGAAQGLTLGFADELGGGLGAAAQKLQGSDTPLLDLYIQNRDKLRQDLERARKSHPYITGGAQFLGSIPTVLATGGTGLGSAALAGGVMAAGESNADLTKGQVGQFVKDTGTGAVVGAGTAGLAQAAAPYVQKAANSLAVKALGPKVRHLKKMIGTDKVQEMGQALHDEGIIKPLQSAGGAFESLADRTNELGQSIEQGFAGAPSNPVIDPFAVGQAVKQEAGDALKYVPEGGKTLQRLSNYLDNELALAGVEVPSPVRQQMLEALANERASVGELIDFWAQRNASEAAEGMSAISNSVQRKKDLAHRFLEGSAPSVDEMANNVTNPYAPAGSLDKSLKGARESQLSLAKSRLAEADAFGKSEQNLLDNATSQRENALQSFANSESSRLANLESNIPSPQRGMSVEEAWKARKGIDQAIDFQKQVPDMPGFMQGLVSTRNKLQQEILANAPEELAGDMGKYHLLEGAEGIAKDAAVRNMANRSISPSDYFAGLGGLVRGHGDPVTAAAWGAGNHLLRTRGSSTAAWTLNKLSKALQANPKMFGAYAGPLMNAAQRGENSLAAAHFLMSQQQPEYRETLKRIDGEE